MWLMETPGWSANCGLSSFQIVPISCPRTVTSVVQYLRDHGTFKPQTHDRGRERTERILQAEEQILERVEEEPNIIADLQLKLEFHSL
ncbi:hypothetical protein Zmor_015200 [Zophobas morio]|uniref:Uncharacterized protein n=1 Tax=Zophobas morio TaxID=2755281 RepID=A0AA38IGR5_9CUCU|nr:hypothetical protein Zmor_015200 [Zophobas morio]